jgi:hypothetical protein
MMSPPVVRWSRRLSALLVLLSLSACDAVEGTNGCPLVGPGDCYRYQAFDEQGGPLAAGFLTLETDASSPDRITGTWQFARVAGAVGAHPVGLGALVGQREGEAFSASLADGTANGAELSGLIRGGEIEGIWVSTGPGSGAFQGTFGGRVVTGP